MSQINIVFPHQLFEQSTLIDNGYPIYIIEEYLYFRQYRFHKQKIAFHRATMQAFAAYLTELGRKVHYIDSSDEVADIRNFGRVIKANNISKIHVIDPVDDWLSQRLTIAAQGITIQTYDSPLFLNTRSDLATFFKPDKKSFFQTTFYKQQRKRLNILLDSDAKPIGGKWTYDVDNRKKYPKQKIPPSVHLPGVSKHWDEAICYTNNHFGKNPGEITQERLYPIDFDEAQAWLKQFLSYRFYDFGAYEDAIVKEHIILNHSLLSPLMNVGLISPQDILSQSLAFATSEHIPINSTEGFVRQIIGWREFIRGMYEVRGSYARTRNFWKFNRKIPPCFYDGTTGIAPVDDTIKKILKTGYCHHIERLMIIGNIMVLCRFDPNEVYRWFMELFVDAYDWVMVPNVYGMSQFADGGTFATKPYISGSNYIKKMSNYTDGSWTKIWDGLFWTFMYEHQDFFRTNPRLSMLVRSLDKMAPDKLQSHLAFADQFIKAKLEVNQSEN